MKTYHLSDLMIYQDWRRGYHDEMPQPREVSKTIEACIKEITTARKACVIMAGKIVKLENWLAVSSKFEFTK